MACKQHSTTPAGIQRDASLSTLSTWAKELQNKGQYPEAEIYYSRAIAKIEASPTELPTSWSMDMLEGRVAAREKMGRLEEALSDADRMLKVELANPRGYICMGRLFVARRKFKSAMNCYEYGVKKCIESHDAYRDLVKSRDALAKSLADLAAAKKKRDPIATFPPEILFMVFSYLPFRDLVKCHRISRQWRTIATSEPSLYRTVDLLSVFKQLTSQNVRALTRYAAGDIRTLKIRSLTVFRDSCYGDNRESGTVPGFRSHKGIVLGPLFQNLECFYAPEGLCEDLGLAKLLFGIPHFPSSTLRSIQVGCCFTIQHVESICDTARQLEQLECVLQCPADHLERIPECPGRYPSIKYLGLTLVIPMIGGIRGLSNPNQILTWFPNVEVFTLSDMFQSVGQVVLLPLWKSLKTIRVYGASKLQVLRMYRGDTPMSAIELRDLPNLDSLETAISHANLERLCLESVPKLDTTVLSRLKYSASTLKYLTLSSPQFEVQHIEPFLRAGGTLKHINMNSLRNVNDGTLSILHSFIYLERLEVDNCDGIMGHGIIKLVEKLSPQKGGRLTSISVKGNENVRRQTIDWARSLGVVVSIS